jgi:hypothetical protein
VHGGTKRSISSDLTEITPAASDPTDFKQPGVGVPNTPAEIGLMQTRLQHDGIDDGNGTLSRGRLPPAKKHDNGALRAAKTRSDARRTLFLGRIRDRYGQGHRRLHHRLKRGHSDPAAEGTLSSPLYELGFDGFLPKDPARFAGLRAACPPRLCRAPAAKCHTICTLTSRSSIHAGVVAAPFANRRFLLIDHFSSGSIVTDTTGRLSWSSGIGPGLYLRLIGMMT